MSELLRETAQWRKGKTTVISEYLANHSQLMEETAGKGFVLLPGYAYEADNLNELRAKLSLSELNFKILSETVERELKQTGIDYGLSYQSAVIAWELEKQSLLAAWEREYASLKQNMAVDEEIVTRLLIQVGTRAVYLLEQKTIIELAMEGYRADLVSLDATVYPYEVQLANAKLATAQKKLTVIPILEEILSKEQELLAIEQDKAAEYTSLMTAEMELATKKELLLEPLAELVSVMEQYKEKLILQMDYEGQIADERLAQAESFARKALLRLTGLETEIETSYKEIELITAKRDLHITAIDNENELSSKEIEKETLYQSDYVAKTSEMLETDRTGQQTVIANKTTTNTTHNATKVAHSLAINAAEDAVSTAINAEEIRKVEEIAELEAAAKITANLTHLIG